MSIAPPTIRAFLAGNSGSGKSQRAWTLYLARFPRRLLVDLTGEWEDRADAVALDVPGAVDAIRQLAPRGKWTVAVALDASELPELVDWLMPIPNLRASPILAMGGAVLLADEVDLLAAPGTASEAVRTLFRRSRHVGLSVIATSQRPANVSREVSAQSTHALALALSEPRDVDYMVDLMRWDRSGLDRWRQWTYRHRHGAVWRDLRTGQELYLPDAGAAVAWPGAPAPAPAPVVSPVPSAGASEAVDRRRDPPPAPAPRPPATPDPASQAASREPGL